MNKLYFRYLAGQYFKNCLIFTISFVLFYVFVDLLANYKRPNLKSSALLLYISFTCISAIYYVLPISQILSMIYTKITMIKKNEFIALYSLGLDRNASIIPAFLVSIVFSLVAISFNFTNAAYAENYKNNILKLGYVSKDLNDLFFKYKDEYVYIKNYKDKVIFDIKILKKQNNEITNLIKAKKGIFANGSWILEDVVSIDYNIKDNFDDVLLVKEKFDKKVVLKDFKPEILDNLESDEISLKDAFFYLKNFQSDKDITRANIYRQSIFLMFAPFLSLIIFYKLPIMPRMNDLNIVAIVYTCFSLLVYGVLYLLLRFAQNGAINPELSILLPILLIILYSLMKFHKNR